MQKPQTKAPPLVVLWVLYSPQKEVVWAGHLLSGQVTARNSTPGLLAPNTSFPHQHAPD